MSAVETPKDVTGGKGHKGKSKEAFKGKLLQLKGKAKGIKGKGTGKGKSEAEGKGNGGTGGTQPPVTPTRVVDPPAPVPSPPLTTADSETTPPSETPAEETPSPQEDKGLMAGGSGGESQEGAGEEAAEKTPPLKRPLFQD